MKIVRFRKMMRMHSATASLIGSEIRRFSFETCGEVVREILRIWIPQFAI